MLSTLAGHHVAGAAEEEEEEQKRCSRSPSLGGQGMKFRCHSFSYGGMLYPKAETALLAVRAAEGRSPGHRSRQACTCTIAIEVVMLASMSHPSITGVMALQHDQKHCKTQGSRAEMIPGLWLESNFQAPSLPQVADLSPHALLQHPCSYTVQSNAQSSPKED